jgi:predicted transcriptional regulator
MNTTDEKLKNICDQLKKGVVPPKETVRAFLLWFGAERRGFRVVRGIRYRLAQHGLVTEPDFEYAYIDGYIGFVRDESKGKSGEDSTEVLDATVLAADPTHRVGRLEAAHTQPVSVKPDSTLKQIVTLMLTSDFSQLPVMTGTRDVKGVVSWKTIGSRLALNKDCVAARDCMEPAQVISTEESLFSAISVIAANDYVLVRGNDQQITGIITASDFNEQFRKLAEPFLLVGEIENGIRRMLRGKFTASELKAAKAPDDTSREVDGVADLTFGEYIRLLEPEKNWKKVNLEIDRVEFVKRLAQIRDIRNDVMHFDPDGLEDEDVTVLREFAQFLKRLRDVGAV